MSDDKAHPTVNENVQELLAKAGVELLPGESSFQGFHRHAASHNWSRSKCKKWSRRIQFAEANAAFTDLDKLNSWLFNLGELPEESIRAARAKLKTLFVNICDLVLENFQCFNDLKSLRKYSVTKKKIFPLNEAKEEGLRDFLRHFFSSH